VDVDDPAALGVSDDELQGGTVVPPLSDGTVYVSIVHWRGGATVISGDCTGALLQDRWIVLAAHCLYDEYGVRIPDDNVSVSRTPDALGAGAIATFVHPGYDPGGGGWPAYDIALVELGVAAWSWDGLTGYTRAINTTPADALRGEHLRCYGYGGTVAGADGGDGLLRRGDFVVEGDGGYGRIGIRSATAHLWPGDSGGPCFRGDALVGVASKVETVAEGALAVEADVGAVRGWIAETMQGQRIDDGVALEAATTTQQQPSLAVMPWGRIVAVRTSDGGLSVAYRVGEAGTPWYPGTFVAAPLPVAAVGAPAAAEHDGYPHVFFRGADGQLWDAVWRYWTWEVTPLGGALASAPTVTVASSSRLDVLAVEQTTGKLLHRSLEGTTWSPWHRAAGVALKPLRPAASTLGSGRVLVSAIAADGSVKLIAYEAGAFQRCTSAPPLWIERCVRTDWSEWIDLGGNANAAPAMHVTGELMGPAVRVAIRTATFAVAHRTIYLMRDLTFDALPWETVMADSAGEDVVVTASNVYATRLGRFYECARGTCEPLGNPEVVRVTGLTLGESYSGFQTDLIGTRSSGDIWELR